MHEDEAKAEAFNTVARTCARGGMLDEGLALLEQMQQSSIDVGRATVCLGSRCRLSASILCRPFIFREQRMLVTAAHLVRARTKWSHHAALPASTARCGLPHFQV